MRKSRAVLLFLVIASLAVLASACKKKPANDPLALIPATAGLVAHVDMKALAATKLFQESAALKQAEGSADQGTANLAKSVGIDPAKDVDSLAMAMVFPKSIMGKEPPGMTVVTFGRFNPEKIREAAGQKFNQKTEYAGVVIQHDGKEGLAVPDAGLVIGGSVAEIQQVLDIRAGKAKGLDSASPVLQGLPAAEKSRPLWASVGLPDAMWDEIKKNPMSAFLLGNVPAVSALGLSMDIAEKNVLSLFFNPKEAGKAEDLKAGLEGLMAMGKMMAGSQPDAAEALNSAKVLVEEGRVKISFDIPSGTIEKYIQKGAAQVLGASPSGVVQPAGGAEPPAPGTEQPAAGTPQPAGGTEQPAAGTPQPAGGTEQPAAGK